MIRRNYPFIISLLIISAILACATMTKEAKMGKKSFEEGEFDKAVEYYQEALKKKPENKTLKQLLSNAKSKACESHLQKAKKIRNRGFKIPYIKSALEEVDIALSFLPSNNESRKYKKTLENHLDTCNKNIGELTSAARVCEDKKAWDSALENLNKASRLNPEDDDIKDAIETLRANAVDHYIALSEEPLKQKQWQKAIMVLLWKNNQDGYFCKIVAVPSEAELIDDSWYL